jgi:hypothetical protein
VPPTFTGSYINLTLGCNPTTSDISATLGTATAIDACGAVTITPSDGAVITSSCSASQTRIFIATDACGNTATTSRTLTWIYDFTPPAFTGSYTDVTLGCNPTNIDATLGSATATDACGAVSITQSDGSISSNGCLRTQIRTFTANDACGNTATVSKTVSWTSDVTPPTITATGTSLLLGCNSTATDINAALGSATATDACGTPTVTSSDGHCINNELQCLSDKDVYSNRCLWQYCNHITNGNMGNSAKSADIYRNLHEYTPWM